MSISLCSRDRHPRIPRFSLFHLSALWLITSSTRVILGCCTPTAAVYVYFQYMPKSAVVVLIQTRPPIFNLSGSTTVRHRR